MSIQQKTKCCISCGSPLFGDIVMIGEQYPSAVFLSENIPEPKDFQASSLNLTRCSNPKCSLIQLSQIYNLQYVFDNYPYESAITANMKQILQEILDDAQKLCPLGSDDVVLDRTHLRFFAKKNIIDLFQKNSFDVTLISSKFDEEKGKKYFLAKIFKGLHKFFVIQYYVIAKKKV